MHPKHILYLAVSTMLAVSAAAIGWAFLGETLVLARLGLAHEDHGDAARWAFVLLATGFSAVVVAAAAIAAMRLVRQRLRAEAAMRDANALLEARVAERTAELEREIADRIRIERDLREKEATLRHAQRLARLGQWRWSLERDELISCSAEFARIHSVDMDEIHERMRVPLARRVHPGDLERVAAAFRKTGAQRDGYEIEYRLVRPDGEVRYVLELAETVYNSSGRAVERLGVLQDITEMKRAELALRESQDLYGSLIRLAPVSIFVQSSAEGTIEFANDRGVALLGAARREDLIGRSLIDYLHPDDREQSRERNRRILAGEPVEPVADGRIVRPDGSIIFVERSVSACTYQGRPALQSVLHDITERKADEMALLVAQEEAELANRAKSEFLANMSHELRTPLNAVIGFAELIETEQLGPIGNPKYAEYAGDIIASGQHLLSLINDILDLSKIEAGQVEIHDENIDVNELVRTCLKLMGDRASKGHVDLIVQVGPDVPFLRADRRMMKQALVNLLSNAIKFTPPGGRVTVRAWPNPQLGYFLQVTDSGIGIALEDLPKAMARFGQIDSDAARRFEGTGLGLPLTKSLVEAHGGSLDLESEVGTGTTATACFPAHRIISPFHRATRSPAA